MHPISRHECRRSAREVANAHQKVVVSTTTLTVPGSLQCFVKVSSISIDSSSSSVLSSESKSSGSQSSKSHDGEPEDLNTPEAAAWVSVGELSAAAVLFTPREFRAMRIWDGLLMVK